MEKKLNIFTIFTYARWIAVNFAHILTYLGMFEPWMSMNLNSFSSLNNVGGWGVAFGLQAKLVFEFDDFPMINLTAMSHWDLDTANPPISGVPLFHHFPMRRSDWGPGFDLPRGRKSSTGTSLDAKGEFTMKCGWFNGIWDIRGGLTNYPIEPPIEPPMNPP